jgi:hypothetical protein
MTDTFELDQPLEASNDSKFERCYRVFFLAHADSSKHFVGEEKYVVVFENGGRVSSFRYVRPAGNTRTIRSFK